MALEYKIIHTADLNGLLSQAGEELISVARHNKDRTKIIYSINHTPEEIALIFISGFDGWSFLSTYRTYSHQEALEIMNTDEWREDEGLI